MRKCDGFSTTSMPPLAIIFAGHYELTMLPEEDQKTVVSFLDAFIKHRKFEELVHS
jgi:hypothetical protein